MEVISALCIYFGSLSYMRSDHIVLSTAVSKALTNEIKEKSPFL